MKEIDFKKQTERTDKLLSEMENLSNNERNCKNADIKHMIDRYTGLTDVIEERRNKIHDNALTLIGIILTAATVFAALDNWQMVMSIPIAFLAIQFITQLIIMFCFYYQNKSEYVFKQPLLKDYSNKWKWFYYGNDFISKISVGAINDESEVNYLQGLNSFIENYVSENDLTEMRSNIQQLFLLQVHNYYKNRYYLVLANIQRIGSIISVGAAVLTFIIIYVLPHLLSRILP